MCLCYKCNFPFHFGRLQFFHIIGRNWFEMGKIYFFVFVFFSLLCWLALLWFPNLWSSFTVLNKRHLMSPWKQVVVLSFSSPFSLIWLERWDVKHSSSNVLCCVLRFRSDISSLKGESSLVLYAYPFWLVSAFNYSLSLPSFKQK